MDFADDKPKADTAADAMADSTADPLSRHPCPSAPLHRQLRPSFQRALNIITLGGSGNIFLGDDDGDNMEEGERADGYGPVLFPLPCCSRHNHQRRREQLRG